MALVVGYIQKSRNRLQVNSKWRDYIRKPLEVTHLIAIAQHHLYRAELLEIKY